jgi:hypothetical protein
MVLQNSGTTVFPKSSHWFMVSEFGTTSQVLQEYAAVSVVAHQVVVVGPNFRLVK